VEPEGIFSNPISNLETKYRGKIREVKRNALSVKWLYSSTYGMPREMKVNTFPWAHNPKVGGSNPPPATMEKYGTWKKFQVLFVCWKIKSPVRSPVRYPAPNTTYQRRIQKEDWYG
jgi:hypothetical protein